MALSPKQIQQLKDFAQRNGMDMRDVMAKAESMAKEPTDSNAGGLPATVRDGFYAYQYQVLKVNEIRASLGQPPVPDGEMFYNDWLARHGGTWPAPATPTDKSE